MNSEREFIGFIVFTVICGRKNIGFYCIDGVVDFFNQPMQVYLLKKIGII